MSAVEVLDVGPVVELPQVYIACPLTGLPAPAQRQIRSDIETVKHAIEAATHGDRVADERWPLRLYAPIDKTAPWLDDGLTPDEVYRTNITEVHNSDALVVVAEKGGSTGIGQELEWAVRLGIPVLYLSPSDDISRHVRGTPGFVSAQSYGGDPVTLAAHVTNFLHRWRPMVLDGPRRRSSKRLRYQAITARLHAAWVSCANPTLVAAQVRVDLRYLRLALGDPLLVSAMPTETLISLAHELGVDLTNHSPATVLALPGGHLRALVAAAEEAGWSDAEIEEAVVRGRAALAAGSEIDLRTVTAWSQLHKGKGT
jgi:hypothetical protein